METRMMPIRALYTINGQAPYMLARSSSKIQVYIVPQHLAPPPPVAEVTIVYAKVSLRPCLDALCQASPEIIPSGGRDWSVYVFDPLESQQTGAVGAAPTVAVGLGWLSDALRSADPPSIFGTIMSDGIRDDSLEVIFSLREGNRIPLPRANTWSAPLPPAEKKVNKRNPGALFTKDPLRWPKDEKDAPSPSFPVATVCTPSDVSGTPPSSQRPIKRSDSFTAEAPSAMVPTSTQTTAVAPTDNSTQAALQTLLLALASSQQNQQLFSLLSSIDSSSAATPNPDLVQTLGRMLSSAASAPPPTTNLAVPPAPPPISEHPHADTASPFTFLSVPDSSTTSGSSPASASLSPSTSHPDPSTPPNGPCREDDEVVVLLRMPTLIRHRERHHKLPRR